MTDATLGLTFRETMAGPFALGPTDPAAGAQQGRSQGTELSMHSTITIPDLDRFLEDPTHAGNLTAHIDFTPFGANIPSTDGVFNLFSPADDPRMKLMVYELGFRHDGKDYYLAGRKQVKDDPGWDLWADTTTLFTRLHQGRDPSGTVVGAGILSLGVKELVSLVSTMRALNANSAAQKVEALAKFGRFFLGDLWENYSRMASP